MQPVLNRDFIITRCVQYPPRPVRVGRKYVENPRKIKTQFQWRVGVVIGNNNITRSKRIFVIDFNRWSKNVPSAFQRLLCTRGTSYIVDILT